MVQHRIVELIHALSIRAKYYEDDNTAEIHRMPIQQYLINTLRDNLELSMCHTLTWLMGIRS